MGQRQHAASANRTHPRFHDSVYPSTYPATGGAQTQTLSWSLNFPLYLLYVLLLPCPHMACPAAPSRRMVLRPHILQRSLSPTKRQDQAVVPLSVTVHCLTKRVQASTVNSNAAHSQWHDVVFMAGSRPKRSGVRRCACMRGAGQRESKRKDARCGSQTAQCDASCDGFSRSVATHGLSRDETDGDAGLLRGARCPVFRAVAPPLENRSGSGVTTRVRRATSRSRDDDCV